MKPVLKARESWKINCGAASRNASNRPRGKASPLILEISELGSISLPFYIQLLRS